MKKYILSNSSKDINSKDCDNKVSLEFKGNQKLLPFSPLPENLNMFNQYLKEKDESFKYRLCFSVYPIFSNVLFNAVTEIVEKEGGKDYYRVLNDNAKQVGNENYTVSSIKCSRINMIRNTEFSYPKHNISYHCGLDIFNNHILRSTDFTPIIDKLEGVDSKEGDIYEFNESKNDVKTKYKVKDVFNTILDYSRNDNGMALTDYPLIPDNWLYKNDPIERHLYMTDNILSLDDSINSNLKEKNGWIGFSNKSGIEKTVKANNGEEILINKVMNDKPSCSFIELYPDSSLFSFSPKKNKYKKRLEYNWKCSLLYPCRNQYSGGNILTEGINGLPLYKDENGTVFTKEYIGPNGLPLILLLSVVNHNMISGDVVLLKDKTGKSIKCKVISVGDEEGNYKKNYFSIKKIDTEIIPDETFPFTHMSKIENGYECRYYFRMLKKIKKADGTDLHVDINSYSFAQNIYGDEMSQIIFTDDVDLYDYKDNLGRPITELFVSFIKNNKGHDTWYRMMNFKNSDEKIGDSDIEFSHAFGKLTSGLNLPNVIKNREYCTVRYQHNILPSKDTNKNFYISDSSSFIENGIISDMDEFYGDLVEFSVSKVQETVIEPIYYRFNTGQREYNTEYGEKTFSYLFNDSLIKDDYEGKFIVVETDEYKGYANLNPEGYVYRPHRSIKIKEYDDTVNQNSDVYLKLNANEPVEGNIVDGKYVLSFVTQSNYNISGIDTLIAMNKKDPSQKVYGKIKQVKKLVIVEAIFDEELPFPVEDVILLKKNMMIPSYAYPLDDGTGTYLWRNLIKNSDSKNLSIPFSNGAFYVQDTIVFPLQRQNPFEEYPIMMKYNNEEIAPVTYIPSKKMDISYDEYENINIDTICW